MRAFVYGIGGLGFGIVMTIYVFANGFGASGDRPDRSSAAEVDGESNERSPRLPRPIVNSATEELSPTADVETLSEAAEPHRDPERPLPSQPVVGSYPEESLRTELEARYFGDAPRTRQSLERENFIRKTFSDGQAASMVSVTELECRETMCQGVLEFTNMQDAETVFRQTFLSQEFSERVPDAVSVPTREERPDGSVRATFYIHPQEVFVATQEAHTGH